MKMYSATRKKENEARKEELMELVGGTTRDMDKC
jgi:hypothetical protein